jgi:hypothetical protein
MYFTLARQAGVEGTKKTHFCSILAEMGGNRRINLSWVKRLRGRSTSFCGGDEIFYAAHHWGSRILATLGLPREGREQRLFLK